MAQIVTSRINADFGTHIHIDKIHITYRGKVDIKKVWIADHHADTLFSADCLQTDVIHVKDWYSGNLHFGSIQADKLYMKMINYKNEKLSSLDVFVAAFESEDKTPSKFLMTAKQVVLQDCHFLYLDYNQKNSLVAEFTHITGSSDQLLIKGPNVSTDIKKLAFDDYRGLHIEDLKTDFSYTLNQIRIENSILTTKHSKIEGDLVLDYIISDFSDFNNKVKFSGNIKKASVSTVDLKKIYAEFGTRTTLYFNTKIKGTLNDLSINQLYLKGSDASELIGDFKFKNLLAKDNKPFIMKANIRKYTTNYRSLIGLLPRLLHDKLPSVVTNLGDFTLRGTTEVTNSTIDGHFELSSALGDLESDLSIQDMTNIEQATYDGDILMQKFDLGKLITNTNLGAVQSSLKIKGQGFSSESLNTLVEGKINSIYLNKYTYTNIDVNGKFKFPTFEGLIDVNEPNLKMNFNGLIKVDAKENEYLFASTIEYADLYQLKLSTKDTISVLKGYVDINVKGTNIDDLSGKINIKKASYINPEDTYYFEDFEITSLFDAQKTRTLTINSPDIIEGQMVGKFKFKDVKKIVENALGSIYVNYSPHQKVQNQFLTFDFKLYNKIIDIFLPNVYFGANTSINGEISTNDNKLIFNFKSPEVSAYKNKIYNLGISIDTKNKKYNTQIALDSIRTANYKFSEINLTNQTKSDTLFVNSAFKGGEDGTDVFNLNFYHTINKDNNSVVGIKKSLIDFKKYTWYINEQENDKNKIVFEKTIKNFSINDIVISHENQKATLNGVVNEDDYKKINLSFVDIPVDKITPSLDKIALDGKLNGAIDFIQEKEWYKPTAALSISNLSLNEYDLGYFKLNILGDSDLKKFEVISSLKNELSESFSVIGNIDIINEQTVFDLDLKLNQFNLATLSPLGADIIKNIEGLLSGRMSIIGPIKKPEINGRFYLDKTSLTVPYLNVNYVFKDKSVVDVTESKFSFKNIDFEDKNVHTKGKLDGGVTHSFFEDWFLDLKIRTNKLLVLDTKDSEDALYFGKAFIQGNAKISGPTNALVIDVKAKSKEGTEIKIPISDSESLGDNTFISFVSENEKYNKIDFNARKQKEYKGLEMVFDLEVTPEATLEVIIDRQSGHGIKGKGFGNILLNINTLGKFNIWGDFIAHQGQYNFKYGGLIDKKFEVSNGGTIRWEGDPMRAILNLEAVYKTQANPSVLIDNPSFNKPVPVNVKIKLTDQLIKPSLDFIIDFPTISSVLKSELDYKLNDKNTRQTQALYLLSSGGFLSAANGGQNAVTGNLFERASSLINGALEDQDSKLQFGLNYVQRNNTAFIQTEGRVGLTFAGQLNERISVNGKFGVPTGGASQSGIIGEGRVEWRLNKDNTLQALFFNKENDINYIGESIGYTQGVGLSYQIDFNNYRSLLAKIAKKSKEKPVEDKKLKAPDSFVTPEKIEVPKPKTNTDELFKNNIPNDEY